MSDSQFQMHEDWCGNSADFRMKEACLFFNEHLDSCGRISVDSFRAVAMADAALFALVSIKDFVSEETRLKLESSPLFAFLKCLRNLTAHAYVVPNRTATLMLRISEGSQLTSEQLLLPMLTTNLDHEFMQMTAEKPSTRRSVDMARSYLAACIADKQFVMLDEVIRSGIEWIEKTVAEATR
ncbi:hypothetical protein GCM10008098_21740 [Rhodanobacter panaciterrae]|uniref:Uncharacterized protein n=1 Tax=Rhodanobacter panaciterrae TaxID=490572 RepID=A0ABQ2ZWV1_9GAMM|nr:hypothetical protein [Rhodanobacter panaciterrae]GGY28252.1 hypothetical protein GCM10008098_21740 [Rhodanobacter panaciterrae]